MERQRDRRGWTDRQTYRDGERDRERQRYRERQREKEREEGKNERKKAPVYCLLNKMATEEQPNDRVICLQEEEFKLLLRPIDCKHWSVKIVPLFMTAVVNNGKVWTQRYVAYIYTNKVLASFASIPVIFWDFIDDICGRSPAGHNGRYWTVCGLTSTERCILLNRLFRLYGRVLSTCVCYHLASKQWWSECPYLFPDMVMWYSQILQTGPSLVREAQTRHVGISLM